MLIRKATDLTYADITPKAVYLDRRKFLQAMGIVSAAAVAYLNIVFIETPFRVRFRAIRSQLTSARACSWEQRSGDHDRPRNYSRLFGREFRGTQPRCRHQM